MSDTLERLRERMDNGAFFEAELEDYNAVRSLLDIAEAAQEIGQHYQRVGTRVPAAKLQRVVAALAALDSTGGAER